ncbi:MAG: hypothetical protein WD342_12370 [Verrucomicrobiales bacterium]
MLPRLALILLLVIAAPTINSCLPDGSSPRGDKPASDPRDSDFIGLPLSQGEALAERRGLRHRIIKEDGEDRPHTKDYRPDRVNFEIQHLKIVDVSRG